MADRIKINEQVTISGQPSPQQITKLAEEGFRTVINLRMDNEEEGMLRPMDEADVVRGQGMEYLHLPVSMKQLRDEQVDEYRHAVESLEGPFLVHCRSAKRAGLFAIMHVAGQQGWSGQQAVENLENRGIEVPDAAKTFVCRYVDQRASKPTS